MHPAARKAVYWAGGLFAAYLLWSYLVSLNLFTYAYDMAIAPVWFVVHSVFSLALYVAAALVGAAVVINILAPRPAIPEVEHVNPTGGQRFTG